MSVRIRLWEGDCVERLEGLDDGSVGAVVCDPPYGLFFMGKEWDADGPGKLSVAFDPKFWGLVRRKLRPGGVVKALGGTRTFHRMCRAMEAAGLEDVHLEAHVYGSGFPKSTNISKMIDKRAGAEPEVVGYKRGVGGENMNDIVRGAEVRQTTDRGARGVGAYGTGAKQVAVDVPVTRPTTEEARRWDGYGTGLKPAGESVVCARKPVG